MTITSSSRFALPSRKSEMNQKKAPERSSVFPYEHTSIMVRVDGDADRGFVVRQALIQVTQLLASLRFARLAEVID
ncbi:hypothetical protein [Ralstonia solanacearum]|uniref:hypothetical protein n=1 Tax=Ralstonia solanacearum TaxID=305 RepID=UPI001E61FC5C|nr:hypothetical protein [Ralstonia solanacearum]